MVLVVPWSLIGAASAPVTAIVGKGDNGLGADCFAVDSASVVPGLPGSLCDSGSVRVTFAAGEGGTGSGAADGTPWERDTSPVDAGGAALLVVALAGDVSVPSTLRNRAVLRRERVDEKDILRAAGREPVGSLWL